MRALPSVLLVMLAPLLLGSAERDHGLLLELDRIHFSLSATDLADGAEGPTIRVALGSPAHPTPEGEYPLRVVVRNPGWRPGDFARSRGARSVAPSTRGPLGAVKIPFAERGEIAVHGGAHPLLLGKPVSLGCVRAADDDLLGLIEWLEERGALGAPVPRAGGEIHQPFRRPARVVIR